MKTGILLIIMLVLAGCGVVEKTGAAVALPFAAIGDTLFVVPVNGLAKGSESLIAKGDNHIIKMVEEHEGKTTLELSQSTASFYYVPGYALFPFQMWSHEDNYPMTKSCMAKFGDEKKVAADPIESSAKDRLEKDEFKEW